MSDPTMADRLREAEARAKNLDKMLHSERQRNRRKLKTMADMGRSHPMVRGEVDSATARARHMEACFDKAINERDAALARVAALEAEVQRLNGRRCDGCENWRTNIRGTFCVMEHQPTRSAEANFSCAAHKERKP
jgi:hypothetical protein